MKYVIMHSVLLLAGCNAPNPTHTVVGEIEQPVQPATSSAWMYTDLDPFVQIDGMTSNQLIGLFGKMHHADQKWRDSLHSGKSENEKLFLQKMHANDEVNLKILNRVIKKYGWPKKSSLGEEAAETAWLIIWHHRSNRHILCRHFDEMEKEARAGEMSAALFQQIKDQIDILSPDQIDY
ncbi:hypothetical protein [Dyadobacter sandarakinus]|uniref:Uncharacterized protein n=1 Tax=Dyadobacter sandarakinus TaxID=2747268 RepID=A0ABX7IA79_9BACT|nr:hypothetical protein [Dyadobacter sandarakinus]QRR02723.1 hypothetical protein HWI92_18280 [Dyadobacter sandarakinus]